MADEQTTPEWLSVKVVEDEVEAELIEGFLQSEGFEAQLDNEYSHTYPTHMGKLGRVAVMVPADQAEEAKRVLLAREAQSEAEAAADMDSEDTP
jgi:phosphoenolpyruvate carboxylase